MKELVVMLIFNYLNVFFTLIKTTLTDYKTKITVCALCVFYGLPSFSESEKTQLQVPGTQTTLHITFHDISHDEQPWLSQWLSTATQQVASLYGQFPLAHAYFDIKRQQGVEPVPWAQVRRGYHQGAYFYIDTRFSPQDFSKDWVAIHELSHLMIPYSGRKNDQWFSEGLASYYHHLLRGRAGVLSEQEAWQALINGFQRGAKETQQSNKRQTLQQASEKMNEESNIMRVYWAGAVYFLTIDMLLNKHGDNDSLGQRLKHFRDCCLPEPKRWPALKTAKKLDDLGEKQLFQTLYTQFSTMTSFPDYQALLDQIGIQVNPRGQVILDNSAQFAKLRQQLMHGSSTPQSFTHHLPQPYDLNTSPIHYVENQ